MESDASDQPEERVNLSECLYTSGDQTLKMEVSALECERVAAPPSRDLLLAVASETLLAEKKTSLWGRSPDPSQNEHFATRALPVITDPNPRARLSLLPCFHIAFCALA